MQGPIPDPSLIEFTRQITCVDFSLNKNDGVSWVDCKFPHKGYDDFGFLLFFFVGEFHGIVCEGYRGKEFIFVD